MSIENDFTVKVYEEKASTYLETSLIHESLHGEKAKIKQRNLELFLKRSFETLKYGDSIFEIGPGDGANSKFLSDVGYKVKAGDVADAFINETKKKNIECIKFNVLKDKFDKKYNGVLCWRVFVHFTLEDIENALKKIYDSLEDGGIVVFNVMNYYKKDVKSEWVDFSNEFKMGKERFYNYFSKEEIDDIVTKLNYRVLNFSTEGGNENLKWLVYVLKK